jgi:RimJ/RimL family protein N-acetyltransferase
MEFLPGVLSRPESDGYADRIEAHFSEHGFGRYAVELRESGIFIGFAGPAVATFEAHFTPCIDIGYRLLPAQWGKGFATEAVRAVLPYTVKTLALENVVAITVPANIRSRRVMERAGMIYDPSGDFDHPALPAGDRLRRHVLYRYTYS